MRFETINGTLCVMTEPRPLVPSIEYPYVIRSIKTKHSLIITKDMDAILLIFILAYSDEFEVIGYPVADGSKEWGEYQTQQGVVVMHKDGCVVRPEYDNSSRAAIFEHYPTGWQIHEEPKPEPKYKVGDWIEWSEGLGITYQSQITRVSQSAVYSKGICIPLKTITRKLKPSEVIVKIGCLSGTVRPVSTNGIHIWFHLIGVEDKIIATIRISSLDTQTRELVDSLIKAQEEETNGK